MNNCGRDLHFDVVIPRLKATDHKQAIRELSKHAAKALKVSSSRLYGFLIEKENRSSSGIGDGISIPHLQIAGPRKPITMLASLNKAVDCNAIDNQPIDLICLVLSPESDGPYHLRRLSRVSRLLKHEQLHRTLVEAKDEHAMRSLLIDPEGWLMAA